MSGPRELLRRVSANDEACLSALMAPAPEYARTQPLGDQALDPRVRELVRLAALVMVDAPTTSLRWEVERALANGVSDTAVVQALFTTARDAGSAQLVSAASRVGLALGFDMDVEDSDEP
jgi:alkylhydroperoxidase/carboxymuconolactone decarboxylase family protein YurZ